jgi:hypothetical protein
MVNAITLERSKNSRKGDRIIINTSKIIKCGTILQIIVTLT